MRKTQSNRPAKAEAKEGNQKQWLFDHRNYPFE